MYSLEVNFLLGLFQREILVVVVGSVYSVEKSVRYSFMRSYAMRCVVIDLLERRSCVLGLKLTKVFSDFGNSSFQVGI